MGTLIRFQDYNMVKFYCAISLKGLKNYRIEKLYKGLKKL